jgi:hypothetical protein
MNHSKVLPVVAFVLGSTCARASDLNLLGLYVGASAGPANSTYTSFGPSQAHGTGWKLMAGMRPLPFLGAEVEYTNFGSAAFSFSRFSLRYSGTARVTAEGLFAVGYLPLPPMLDVFAKVGLERVHTAVDEGAPPMCIDICPPIPPLELTARESESHVAYGGGAQFRLRSLALRAEYERTRTSLGHPGLLSFGMTWTF